MKTLILLIEKKTSSEATFAAGLTKKGFLVDVVSNGNEALTRLERELPHLVIINASSLRSKGSRISKSIRQKAKGVPLVLILDENDGSIDKETADVVLALPFTLQKLVNRLRPFFPAEGKDTLQIGSLKLNLEQRRLTNGDKQVSLTPRLMSLLKSLMDKPGEVINRADLFRMVWETEYIGDTRTLDVHISWLRQAIEEDPRHPKLIKTVRGVGYRLDVDQGPILPINKKISSR